jgi:hypothetical protein
MNDWHLSYITKLEKKKHWIHIGPFFDYCNTFIILAIIKLCLINIIFFPNQLFTMSKVLKFCLRLLLNACPQAWWCNVSK